MVSPNISILTRTVRKLRRARAKQIVLPPPKRLEKLEEILNLKVGEWGYVSNSGLKRSVLSVMSGVGFELYWKKRFEFIILSNTLYIRCIGKGPWLTR